MNNILLKARQEVNFMKELRKNGALALSLSIDSIETALNQAVENEQKLSNLEEENRLLKTKDVDAKSLFVKIKDRRFRLDSIHNYYVAKEINESSYQKPIPEWYIRINNFGYQCDSEKEANDYVKMLDELLGVNDENSNSKAQ